MLKKLFDNEIYNNKIFNCDNDTFINKWKIIQNNGFKRFYLFGIVRWTLYIVVAQVVYYLIQFKFPNIDQLLAILCATISISLLCPLLSWNYNLNKLKHLIELEKNK